MSNISESPIQLLTPSTKLREAPLNGAPVIEFRGVSKWYAHPKTGERVTVMDNLHLILPYSPNGEFIAVMGQSGAGKSTLLKMLSGMVQPDAGEVFLYGEQVNLRRQKTPWHELLGFFTPTDPGPSSRCATVPQSYTCFPWLTAHQNVMFALGIKRVPKEMRPKIATEYLEKVGLGDKLDSFPRDLSGGQQQRVAIARALSVSPSVLLMDEPFGALDANSRAVCQQVTLNLWNEDRNTVFFITHDVTEGLLLADKVCVLGANPAQILSYFDVPFPRPRTQELTSNPDFIELVNNVLHLLKPRHNS